MATTVDTLLVRIEADMSELRKSLDKVQRDVDKASKGIGAKFKQLGTVMKGALAAVVVQQAGRAGAAMIGLASDIEEMQGKSTVVFGEFRDQVVKDLEAFGDAVGRSTFELEGMASSIQDTFVPMGFARGAAADLSVELTKLAVDVASFNNASDTETMEAFQSALVGNHETVRRFGVVITEATLNQELMRMGLAKGTKEATNAQKVQARLNLITRGTADAHGDAARTAGSFANRSRALKAELSELAGELGSILLPAVTDIVSALLSGAQAAKQFLIDIGALSQYTDDIGGMANQISDLEQKLVELREAEAEQSFLGSIVKDYGLEIQMTEELLRKRKEALQAKKDEIALDNREKALQRTPVLETPEVVDDEAAAAATELAARLKEQREELAASSSEMLISAANQRLLDNAIRDGNKTLERSTRENIILNDLKKKFPDLAKENISLLQQEAAARANAVMNENSHAAALEKIEQAQDNYQASVQDGLSYVLSNIRTNQDLEETLKDLKAAYDAGKISTDEFALAQEQIKEKIAELDPVYKQMKDRANEAFDSVADSITDMVMSGSFNLKKLGDLFKQTMRQMIADALKAAVIKPILQSIFGAVGVAIGGPVGTFIGGIGASAGGGSVSPYAPEIVGERGPELIVPKSASRILNNHDTKNALGMGSNTTIVQNINISTGVQQTVRAEIRSLMPEIANSAKAAVADGKRRGGSYGRAFA